MAHTYKFKGGRFATNNVDTDVLFSADKETIIINSIHLTNDTGANSRIIFKVEDSSLTAPNNLIAIIIKDAFTGNGSEEMLTRPLVLKPSDKLKFFFTDSQATFDLGVSYLSITS